MEDLRLLEEERLTLEATENKRVRKNKANKR
jgi:hypothetical protein